MNPSERWKSFNLQLLRNEVISSSGWEQREKPLPPFFFSNFHFRNLQRGDIKRGRGLNGSPLLLLLQEYIPPPAAERHLTATMSLRRSPPPLKTRSAAAEVQKFCLSLVVTEKLLLRRRERREIRSVFSLSNDSRRQLNSPNVFRG